MNAIDLFQGYYIISAWLIYAGIIFFLSKDSDQKENSWFLLGIVNLIFLIPLLIEYGIAWSSGYIYEQFASISTRNGYAPFFMLFEFSVSIMASMNIIASIRKNNTFRKFQFVIICIYILGCVIIYGYKPYGYATSIIPGWHTTIYQIGNFYGILIWFVVIVVLALVVSFLGRVKK
ncbi:MAG: hypothetical protein ACRBG0_20985 [Lewinella sp.]|uniref:hypothetical protein n=1 Tax=Lewinella sp. TaxID=2004506 RepID=UPI003D6BC2EC